MFFSQKPHGRSLIWTCLLKTLLALVAGGTAEASAKSMKWTVPVGGNAYRTAPRPSGEGFRRDRTIAWGDAEEVFSVFFHVDRAAKLQLAINARTDEGASLLAIQVNGQMFQTSLDGDEIKPRDIGLVNVDGGYVRVDVRGMQRAGSVFAEIRDLIVVSETADLQLDYVKSNEGNMFYWGRRGPSVHLRYEVPQDRSLKYAYSEITVPPGQDPQGSYFMANGFAEGYFGFQVNSAQERRVLFSVWSPFQTDNPREIPKEQRIVVLGRGPEVHIGQFGNEGSGGQSYLVYPWKAGKTYRFLTEVQPDGQGKTVYTSWFGDKAADEWRLIASFQRPKTNTHLRGFHSFLESFYPTYGHLGRRAAYGNVWVGDIAGKWHECTRARFSVDATGRGRHRLDFTGGSQGKDFFMRNCGFFPQTGQPGKVFTRTSTVDQKPDFDLAKLPRG